MRSRPSFHTRQLKTRSIRPSRRRSRRWRLLPLALLTLLLWFGSKQALGSLFRRPQAILVLGGAPEREVFAADFARQYPDLPVWVSSGTNPEYAEWVFDQAEIDAERVHLDYRAVDTVTNFTTLVDDLKAQGIDSVYLITSDYHMRRAKVIGQIVLGSRDITFKAITVPSGQEEEGLDRAIRDGARAILWVVTGRTGSTWHRTLHQSDP